MHPLTADTGAFWFFGAEQFPGAAGRYVKREDTVRSFKEIIDGKCDSIPEQAFYMAGAIEEVHENAKKLAGKPADKPAEKPADRKSTRLNSSH